MVSRTPARRRRRLPILLGLIVLELVVALGLFEVGLRLAHGFSPGLRQKLYMPGLATHYDEARTLRELLEDSPTGWMPNRRQGDFIMNSRGLRTKEYDRATPPGTLRVVVLGDSFTFASGGVPYEELWHQRLEQHLAESTGGAVEVLSLGVRAVGPDFYRRIWEVEGSELGADLVVVAFYIGNDFTDVQRVEDDPGPLETWARRSYAVRLVRNMWRDRGAGTPSDEPAPTAAPGSTQGGVTVPGFSARYDPERPQMTRKAYLAEHRRRMGMFLPDRSPPLTETYERVRPHLDAIQDQVTARGAQFVLMLIPSEPQVNPELAQELAESLQRPWESFDLELPNRLLTGWAADRGVLCLDLLPAFRREFGGGPRLYRLQDTHWSPAGNALAGSELAEFVTANR